MDGLISLKKILWEFLVETRFLFLYFALCFIIITYITKPFLLITASTILFVTVLLFYIYKKPNIDLKRLSGAILSGSFPSYSALVSALIFIIFSSWVAEYLIKGPQLFKAYASFLFSFGLPFVFILALKEKKVHASDEVEPKKVFISGLSEPNNKFQEFKKRIKETKDLVEINKQIRFNWIPLLKGLENHIQTKTLEEAYILVSDRSAKYKDDFLNIIKELFGDEVASKIKFIPENGGISFDDYKIIHEELLCLAKKLKRKYSDEDISVFISAGTSALTLALTLFAVKEGRQVEYTLQSSKELTIVKIDISPEDIFSLSGIRMSD
jgi:hypothetical protein